ncbi:MAG TPA: caspase family protein [Pyrinomonadaceae bacterium]|nr:caspase family protein [Pyrinomonadaceae bacterium]
MKAAPPNAPARLLAAALLSALALIAPDAPTLARQQQQPAARSDGAQTRDVIARRPVEIAFNDGTNVRLYNESHALVIGVSDYTNGWADLPGAETDVREVSAALARQGFEVVTVMNPTSRNLDQTIKDFINEHGQDDDTRLVVYFAGHGHTVKVQNGRELGFIVPADAPCPSGTVGCASKNDRDFIRAAVSMDAVEYYARSILSKHALFVFDSCFSGSLFEANRAAPPAITKKAAEPVRQFITAGTAEQVVPDRSIFREMFVEALGGEGDLDRDGYVTGSELGYFLETRVANYTNNAQTPRSGKIRNPRLDKGDFVFETPRATPAVIARAPEPAPAVPALSREWTSTAALLTTLMDTHATFTSNSKTKVKVLGTENCTITLRAFFDDGTPYVDVGLPFKYFVNAQVDKFDRYTLSVRVAGGRVMYKRVNSDEAPQFRDTWQVHFGDHNVARQAADYLRALTAECR